MSSAIESALRLSERVPVFPCLQNKRPATPRGFKNASRDPAEIRRFFAGSDVALIGVPTGQVSGLDVLDIDPRNGGQRWLDANVGKLPVTRWHGTRSGGFHVLFQHAEGVRNTAATIAPGVDTRGDGGYVVWWPSHGGSVLNPRSLAEWPRWILIALERPPPPPLPQISPTSNTDGVRRYALAALRNAIGRVAGAGEGSRNIKLNSEAFALARFVRNGALSIDEVAEALAVAARHAGLPPRETVATLTSAMRAGGVA